MDVQIRSTERPILFPASMVQAILAGRKTQTRRLAKPPAKAVFLPDDRWENDIDEPGTAYLDDRAGRLSITCSYGVPGDRLWVRETWKPCLPNMVEYRANFARVEVGMPESTGIIWRDRKWRSSIHMPRCASRITLEVANVRIERLQAISEADAIAEGFEVRMGDGTGPGPGYKWTGPGYWDGISHHCSWPTHKTYHVGRDGVCLCNEGRRLNLSPAVCAFRALWEKINGKRAPWSLNPWVWVIVFRQFSP